MIDGVGITSLVGLTGCPLACRYCINEDILQEQTYVRDITEEQLIDELSIDHSYFVYTNGGITFGGGEPLLQVDSLIRFEKLCPKEWNLTVETSLNVAPENLEKLLQYSFSYIIDIKSLDPTIYESYTGMANTYVLHNLQLIKSNIPLDRFAIKVPCIRGYANINSRYASIQELLKLGFKSDSIIPIEYIITE